MNTIKAIIFIAVIVSSISCKKENVKYTVSGKILKDCSYIPLANSSFFLLDGNKEFSTEDDKIYPFSTDEKGRFCVEYESFNSNSLSIRNSDGGIIHFEGNKNLDIGNVMVYPKAKYELSLKFNNSYNVGDTLLVRSGLEALHKIAYPFRDTTLSVDSIIHKPVGIPASIKYKDIVYFPLSFLIHSGQRSASSFQVKKQGDSLFTFVSCSSFNPIEISID
jgi:hypothetical protein